MPIRQHAHEPLFRFAHILHLHDEIGGFIARHPHQHAIRHAAFPLYIQRLTIHLLDPGVRFHGHMSPHQFLIRILMQFALVVAQDMRRDVIDADMQVGRHVGVQIDQLAVGEIVQFGRDLHARGPAADDGDVEEFCFAGGGAGGEGGFFEEVEEAFAGGHGVGDVFHEEGVVEDAGGAEGVGDASWREDQVVVLEVEGLVGDGVRIVVEGGGAVDGFGGEGDGGDVCFEEAAFAGFAPDGLFGEVEVEEAAGSRGEQRGVGRRPTGGDDGDRVEGWREVVGQIETGPAGADDDDVWF